MENTDDLLGHENKFLIDYEGQKIEKSESFIKWQIEMKKIYGNDAKLFKCNIDNAYFYASSNECKKIPLYKAKCPTCKYTICYYCSRHVNDRNDKGRCCIYRRIYCIFFQDGFYFKRRHVFDNYRNSLIYKIFLIPFLSFIYLVGIISTCFYYNLYVDNGQSNDEYLENYENHIKGKYGHTIFKTIIIFNVLFAIFLEKRAVKKTSFH